MPDTDTCLIRAARRQFYFRTHFPGSEIAVFYGRTLNKSGVYVVNVDSKGPLGKAGIKPGDIITSVGEDEVVTMLDLRILIYNYKIGETVSVGLIREGREITLDVALSERP